MGITPNSSLLIPANQARSSVDLFKKKDMKW